MNKQHTMKWSGWLLPVMMTLLLSACEKVYEAPVPNTAWDLFDSNRATPIEKTSRIFMEGVYQVADGSDEFGDQVAMKWSYEVSNSDTIHYLSIFCEKDIAYFILEGKKLDNELIFNGYWRKMINVETGVARFTIHPDGGATQLLSPAPQVTPGSITLDGIWGEGDEIPTNPVVLTYVRPLNNARPFEILGHRSGGRTSDHLPASENSIGMIRFAARQGSTGIEIDVRLTSDGVPVLYHDTSLNLRLIQKNGLVGGIEDYTFRQINTFVRLIDGESIPTLRDALDAVVYNTDIRFVWLDTKYVGPLDGVRALQKEYLEKAQAAGRDLQIVIGLPGSEQLDAFLALPDYQSAPALCELSLEDVERTQAVVWGPRWTLGTQDSEVAQVQAAGRKAFVWTLDDPPYVEKFINEGNFDGILSNYPSIVAYYYYVKQ